MLFRSQLLDIWRSMPWERERRKKSAMRALTEQQRRILTPEQVADNSAKIIAQLEQMSVFREAQTVMLYYPIHHEVDLRPLLTKYAGQKIFLFPVTHRRSIEVRPYDGEDMMRKGHFGIPEPQTPTFTGHIDLALVPGVLFDRHCHRMGRGGGYYDRWLRRHPGVYKIGVCYSFQLEREDIPHNWLDVRMNRVITPLQTIG
jgi:5-formyltetrahydrofolate cyclo-ligase